MPLVVVAKVYRRHKAKGQYRFSSDWTPTAVRSENTVSDQQLAQLSQYIARRRSQDHSTSKT